MTRLASASVASASVNATASVGVTASVASASVGAKRKRVTQAERRAKHAADAQRFAETLSIGKSTIPSGGGGVFAGIDVPAGQCVGFYEGERQPESAKLLPGFNREYVMEGEPGGRNGHDVLGRLRLIDGSEVNVHDWGSDDWRKLPIGGTAWVGVHANWTRFLNHATDPHKNLALAGSDANQRFGRSHAFYACRPIKAGEELFFSYGAGYWRARGIVPEKPLPAS